MKSVILIRHAKSDWGDPRQKDIDRPLNHRGIQDAPVMADRLKNRVETIDLFISSNARRAFTTAVFFAKAYGVNESDIIQAPELYHPSSNAFYDVINKLDDGKDVIALFSHNGGITDFVNELTTIKTDNMPTCGVFGVEAAIESWKEFYDASKSFCFYDYPKNIQDI